MKLKVELQGGESAQRTRDFVSEVPPFAVGSAGDWQISAPGVAAVHAYLYFDGSTLYLAEGEDGAAPTLHGGPVGKDWAPADVPGEFRIGPVTFRVSMATTPARAAAHFPPMPIPEPTALPKASGPESATVMVRGDGLVDTPQKPPLPHSSVVNVPDEEDATRFHPLPSREPAPPTTTSVPPVPVFRPWSIPVPTAPFPSQPPGPIGVPGLGSDSVPPGPWGRSAAPLPQSRADLATEPGKRRGGPLGLLVAGWNGASLPQKAILVLMPLAFVAVFFMFGEESSAAPASASTASASPSRHSIPNAVAVPAAASSPRPSSAIAPASASGSGLSGSDGRPSTSPAGGVKAEPPPKVGSVTLERAAADAVAAGEYGLAAERFDQLASRQPQHPAFSAAAQILRKKAGGARH